ncbi:MAG TPA: HAD family hydrolase, partial [Bacteroidales bacterium]|nr:HAD family hydrolase [Bacteroidales bacterium]
ISTLREGWELIMAPMMIRAVLGDRHNDVSESDYNTVKSRVNDIIDKTTGIQTLMQMKILSVLVKEFGYVPDEQILDEHGYKHIYNNDLMQTVRMRIEKLNRGELLPEDLTIKNSVAFLKMLYDKGIRLYLTSGTDEEDVKKEAAVLGYDYLFGGRIYGATGNIRDEAKRILLDNLLDSLGSTEAGTIITFGDGPVEIRETRKRGGYTAGIASNDIRRHGLNSRKRARLIKAGADIIIPDFSQADHILKLMNIY